jgi:hypothetical protein
LRPIEANDDHHNRTSDHERCYAAAAGSDAIESGPDGSLDAVALPIILSEGLRRFLLGRCFYLSTSFSGGMERPAMLDEWETERQNGTREQ